MRDNADRNWAGGISAQLHREAVPDEVRRLKMGYDTKCYDLAAAFLADWPEKNTKENRDKLAQHIQNEIESEIEFILEPATKPSGGSEG